MRIQFFISGHSALRHSGEFGVMKIEVAPVVMHGALAVFGWKHFRRRKSTL